MAIPAFPLVVFAHMDRVSPGYGIKPELKTALSGAMAQRSGSDDVAGVCAILEGIRTVKEQNIPTAASK